MHGPFSFAMFDYRRVSILAKGLEHVEVSFASALPWQVPPPRAELQRNGDTPAKLEEWGILAGEGGFPAGTPFDLPSGFIKHGWKPWTI